MFRFSQLRNMSVVCSGRRIGLVQQVVLDPAQKRVRALVLARGMKGKGIVLPEDIRLTQSGFILSERVLPYSRSYEAENPEFVRDTTGLLLGRVIDYAIEPAGMQVIAIEVSCGYFGEAGRSVYWVYRFEASESSKDEFCISSFIVPG